MIKTTYKIINKYIIKEDLNLINNPIINININKDIKESNFLKTL